MTFAADLCLFTDTSRMEDAVGAVALFGALTLRPRGTVESPKVTHVHYDVVR